MKRKEKFIIIDGNSLASRAFYALPLLTTSRGQYTNAVYGFISMFLRLLQEEKPDYITAAFDMSAPTFRHKAYKEYKAQRAESPAEYREQIPLIKEFLNTMSIPYYQLEGFEADDLIGTYSQKAEESLLETLIVTGDADAFQLISPNIKVLMTRKGITHVELVDLDRLKDNFGLTPGQVADFKALKGDPSDNIPGIPGIGEKTALKLLHEFGSLENLLENIQQIKQKKVREKVEEYREQSILSKKLAAIKTDVEDSFDLKQCRFETESIDYSRVRELFKTLEFNTLLERLPEASKPDGEDSQKVFKNAAVIKDTAQLIQLTEKIVNAKELAVLLETTGPNPFRTDIVGVTLSLGPESSYYLPLSHGTKIDCLGKEEVLEKLKPYLENQEIKKICPDAKFIINCLKKEGIFLQGLYFDPFIAAYLLSPGKPSQKVSELIKEFLGLELTDREQFLGKGAKARKIKDIKPEEFKNICCSEAALLFDLCRVLSGQLKMRELDNLFFTLEMPLIEILSAMETEGITVQKDILEHMSVEIKDKLEKIRSHIYELAGQEFNLNSPKQLAFVLFETLKLPAFKKTKTGYSTSAEVLEELASKYEIAEKILHYRQLVKLQGTYVDGLIPLINSKTGKIHSTFKQNVTATGRLSSTEPNLQNIPIRMEEARKIRKAFVSQSPESFLLASDYSQIELRILAHISEDQQLVDSFLNDEDIHRRTAAEVFEIPLEAVTSQMRNSAKVVNFGIIYGMSDYGLSQNLGIERKEAKKYIQSYFEKYPGVRKYSEEIIQKARDDGYVTTIFNRRRYLPDIKHRNNNIRSFAERTAVNTPIQGSAADLIKKSMLDIFNELNHHNFKTKMLLQVHDELIFEVPVLELSESSKLIKDMMESIFQLKVPLRVDLKVGKNLYDMDKLVL
ncbi:DNA polymerase I [Candidatus Contubernalis alkaliaceticus]|uniref:DNA polymerase I n=1 Tax=Candidatus Contubernalis alkaliaceticus TaxID=338645 RepID=UPI001F4BDB54|nr:DNA polymerase I [Candidatus Contubernalis alkalaceticus]UNC91596.1 DNA polymerase I [Candidatus Contubernalis alkalaceticus]